MDSISPHHSQTIEQQKHENAIHQQFDPPPTTPIGEHHGHASGSSLMGKVKGFYQDVVNPASAEARRGLNLVRNLEKVEERISEGLHDPNRFPEVARVAEVRRGLDLCPEEQLFAATRKTRI